jgi:hypothetical protein
MLLGHSFLQRIMSGLTPGNTEKLLHTTPEEQRQLEAQVGLKFF